MLDHTQYVIRSGRVDFCGGSGGKPGPCPSARKNIKKIATSVTDDILEKIDGPDICDINSGHCQEWAERVAGQVPGAEVLSMEHNGIPHAVVWANGRYYDSEKPSGVKDYRKLPIFSRPRQVAFCGGPGSGRPGPCPGDKVVVKNPSSDVHNQQGEVIQVSNVSKPTAWVKFPGNHVRAMPQSDIQNVADNKANETPLKYKVAQKRIVR